MLRANSCFFSHTTGKRLLVGSDSLHIWRQDSTLVNVNDEEHNSEMWGCVWHRKYDICLCSNFSLLK